MAASWIQEFPLLILDLPDVSKKYARRMEYLIGIHGGSEDAGTMIMITPLRAGRRNLQFADGAEVPMIAGA